VILEHPWKRLPERLYASGVQGTLSLRSTPHLKGKNNVKSKQTSILKETRHTHGANPLTPSKQKGNQLAPRLFFHDVATWVMLIGHTIN